MDVILLVNMFILMRITQHKGDDIMVEYEPTDISNVLVEALPYIKKFHKQKIMIKYVVLHKRL